MDRDFVTPGAARCSSYQKFLIFRECVILLLVLLVSLLLVLALFGINVRKLEKRRDSAADDLKAGRGL